ncbi:hypothetical protein JCM31598_37890 [Desulfonatronum parangueonense]
MSLNIFEICKALRQKSYIVHQNPVYFFVLDAQIMHGHSWAGVVEPFAKQFETDSVMNTLNVAKGFAQSVRTVVATQIDQSTPAFD